MIRNKYYMYKSEVYETKQIEELIRKSNDKTIINEIVFTNLAEIFHKAGEFKLENKMYKIIQLYRKISECDYYTSKGEKTQIKLLEKVNKKIKQNGKDEYSVSFDFNSFVNFVNNIFKQTFDKNFRVTQTKIPSDKYYAGTIFDIGYDYLTEKECKAFVKNFKRALKNKELIPYEPEVIEDNKKI